MKKVTKQDLIRAAFAELGIDRPTHGIRGWIIKTHKVYVPGGTISRVRCQIRNEQAEKEETSPAEVSSDPTPSTAEGVDKSVVSLTADVLQLAQKYNLDDIERVVQILQGKE